MVRFGVLQVLPASDAWELVAIVRLQHPGRHYQECHLNNGGGACLFVLGDESCYDSN